MENFDGAISELDGILVAAHELKAPLALMRQLSLALPEMDNSGEKLRAQMVQVSERAMKQVNDLTKIRRLEDGLFELEPVAVREVCDAVTAELRELYRSEKKRDLRVKYSNKSRLVTANRELLYSVIYNFVLNALHYAGRGARAELSVRDHRERVEVQVRDFGPALPTEVWREMRQGFLARPTSVSMRPGSSGLGLYIASRFSRYMQAPVRAVRHRDGTSFYVDLLVSKQAALWD